jgi:AcrR family transcriptional regulator
MTTSERPPRSVARTRMSKSDRTRAHILSVACEVFNERGTAAVSTNLIAAEAGISPGNLYYHFANKPDIIRALLAQLVESHENRWELELDPGASLRKLAENLEVGMSLAWQYRFLERELLALLRADPALRRVYTLAYERRLKEWLAFGERLADQGLMREPSPPRTLGDLGIALWLIAGNWLAFLDVTGDPQDPEQVARVGDLILVALHPYLTARGRRELEDLQAPRAGRP